MMVSAKILISAHELNSAFLDRTVIFEMFIPEDIPATDKLNLLLLNDGQDAEGLGVQSHLEFLYNTGKIQPVVIVAIHASANRVQEYGVSGRPDFLGRGALASAYSHFITKELLPAVHQLVRYPITGKCGFAGCSLGGLSAFDVAWNNPADFDLTGTFSAAFWWRQKDLHQGYHDDHDRILHLMIRETKNPPALKFWIMTGTEDETADRNHNFIIDSIDDAVDVIRELVKKGFRRSADLAYYEVVGGRHEVSTWNRAFPAFLNWAFPRKSFGS